MLHSRLRALLATITLAAAQGCASAPAPVVAAAPAPAPVAPPTPPAPTGRAPSEAVRSHWTFDEPAELLVYADVAGLVRTPLISAFVPVIRTVAQPFLDPTQAQCLDDVLASVQEVLVGAKGESTVVLIRVDETAAKPTACLSAASATPVRMEGIAEAYGVSQGHFAHLPGLFVLGEDADILRAVQQTAPKPAPASLTLAPDQYLAWAMKDEDVSAKGRLLSSADRFRLDVEADVPEPLAKKLEMGVQAMKQDPSLAGLGAAEAAIVKRFISAVSVTRDGKHVVAAFDLQEPVVDQARDLGAAVSLSIYGVRRYIANAKMAEARNTIGQIAKDYAVYWETEDGKPLAKKKLVSFPAVPKTVPRGVKYASTPADWKPWAMLRFSMDRPQYYQYEVRASKDGRSADVIARGDLNGDGKASLFKLSMKVDPKDHSLVVAPNLEETAPEE
jgi:hypothetical protein